MFTLANSETSRNRMFLLIRSLRRIRRALVAYIVYAPSAPPPFAAAAILGGLSSPSLGAHCGVRFP